MTTLLTGSVVICTKNRPDDLARCIESLAAQSRQPDELIVVDAGTQIAEASVGDFARTHPSCRVQHLRAEPGLARQRNLGIGAATGDVIHFLDDDVILDSAYLACIHQSFEREGAEDVVAVGGRPILPRAPHAPVFVFRRLFLWTPLDGTGTLLPSGFPSYTWFAPRPHEHRVEILTGCSCSFRASVFESLTFDEWFSGYGFMEDVDFSYRASRLGRVVVNPQASLLHMEAPSARPDWKRLTEMQIVNHHYVFRKHLPHDAFHLACFWWSELGAALWRTAKAVQLREPGLLRGMWAGYAKVLADHSAAQRP